MTRHEHDAVGEEDRLHYVMGDEQHGRVRLLDDADHQLLHLPLGLGVERAERLVHEENRGPIRQRARDGDPLLHAAGKLVRIGVLELSQLHELNKALGIFLPLCLGTSLIPIPYSTFLRTVIQSKEV